MKQKIAVVKIYYFLVDNQRQELRRTNLVFVIIIYKPDSLKPNIQFIEKNAPVRHNRFVALNLMTMDFLPFLIFIKGR